MTKKHIVRLCFSARDIIVIMSIFSIKTIFFMLEKFLLESL